MQNEDVRYTGLREDGDAEAWVEVDGRRLELPARHHLRNHSPTGFEWGYSGSGPAQLALAILCHHLLEEVHTDPTIGEIARLLDVEEQGPTAMCNEIALRLYQRFKMRHIASIDAARWVIESATVRGWLSGERQRLRVERTPTSAPAPEE